MQQIFYFEAKNGDFKVEIFSNRDKTSIRSKFSSNAEIIEYTSNDLNEVIGRLMREINTYSKVVDISIKDLELNEEEVIKYDLKFIGNEISLTIDGEKKIFSIKDVNSIGIEDFDEQSIVDLRAAIDAFNYITKWNVLKIK